jgi:hypothetical protein
MRALRAFTVVVLGLGLIAAACGGGGGSGSQSPAQAKAEIKTNWERYFDPSQPVSAKPVLIENGDQMQQILQTQSTNPLAKNIKTVVTDVTLQGDNAAVVTYNILSIQTNDTLLPPGSKGQAVKQGGKWKVSQGTFCGLIHAGDTNAKCP